MRVHSRVLQFQSNVCIAWPATPSCMCRRDRRAPLARRREAGAGLRSADVRPRARKPQGGTIQQSFSKDAGLHPVAVASD